MPMKVRAKKSQSFQWSRCQLGRSPVTSATRAMSSSPHFTTSPPTVRRALNRCGTCLNRHLPWNAGAATSSATKITWTRRKTSLLHAKVSSFLNVKDQQTFHIKNEPLVWTHMRTPPSSELRRIDGKEPAAAGRLAGGAAEMGEPAGEEDPQEAPTRRNLSTLLPTHLHEGPAKPVHEEAQSTASYQQEQVVKLTKRATWTPSGAGWT